MQMKTLGKTGLNVPAVGFGGMRFQDISNRAECVETCQYAYEKGIRYFDTAPGYFSGQSEETFGDALHGLKDVVISTKSNQSDGSALRQDFEESLKRLKRDKIEVFHIWWVLSMQAYEQRLRGGAVEAAIRLKEEGLIDHLFISSHMEGDDIIKVLDSGTFSGMTIGYSALNFSFREKAITHAQKNNIAVVTMNPLAGGIIPDNPETFNFLKREKDRSVIDGAIRFIVSNPGVSIALIGMQNKQHVDDAVQSMNPFVEWTRDELKDLKNNLGEKFKGLCTGCGYCKGCPEGLEPSKHMLAYNRKLLGKNDNMVVSSMKWEWAIPLDNWDRCIECGQCEEKCTQHLPIMERMLEIGKLKDQA